MPWAKGVQSLDLRSAGPIKFMEKNKEGTLNG